jgi:hypothetical protein
VSNRQRPRPPVRRRGDYLTELVGAHRSGRLPIPPGMIGIVDIWHDPDCRRPDGGPCTCVADVGALTYPRIPRGD